MNTPIILTNFKTYESATGSCALTLSQAHYEAMEKTGVQFAVAPQNIDLATIAANVNIPVFAQHSDGVDYGSHTGWVLPQSLKNAGAIGVILNHSEHRFTDRKKFEAAVIAAKKAGLSVCICAEDAKEGEEFARAFKPDFIAVEPPELIGGDISVSTAKPELITEAIELIGDDSKVLVGAGVKNRKDVEIALRLGACGVLLASGVTKAENPLDVLLDLAEGVK